MFLSNSIPPLEQVFMLFSVVIVVAVDVVCPVHSKIPKRGDIVAQLVGNIMDWQKVLRNSIADNYETKEQSVDSILAISKAIALNKLKKLDDFQLSEKEGKKVWQQFASKLAEVREFIRNALSHEAELLEEIEVLKKARTEETESEKKFRAIHAKADEIKAAEKELKILRDICERKAVKLISGLVKLKMQLQESRKIDFYGKKQILE